MSGSDFIHAECLVPGKAEGRVTALAKPLSLWGGFDPERGTVSDVNHPDHGAVISGRILVMQGGRGSSSSSSVLLESARLERHPLAIIIVDPDPILAVGALVAADLYEVSIPVVCVSPENLSRISRMERVRITAKAGNCSVARL